MKYISAWMLRTVIRIFESSKHNIITYPLSKSILKTCILLPGLPSQSSLVMLAFSVHLKVWKVYLTITTVLDVIEEQFE